ncbi:MULTISPECIES: N-acetylglucosamine-6-phosphate deacetylase [Enterococcus]|jgi:N-acetylglucosamine-6-phosphate deacetylase|uniref:N-acetylglucosamine-6-phosphate deacetylase n=1 Tax=Enterococcus TaxID=1350 RepID=UPI00032D9424|nr:N-acetylglucosamine-6-phosphate deacetylase [Enterococcus faecalis]EGO8325713.1 N-acetylglucosamine-6-phosphate deacetylase [Enterococcus faecalis]EGO8835841.1 N-acetylglucosamine-6-phosphate deacetylase [Enterococcus faecalis]EHK9411730.1 N-acetylglucosamine-6-phosphate deacetylase [Enterococcus faecalis]EHQ8830938.1 N-acetylglucosamine-6-phosphate deacetylase [Enterococcus faecalis]EHU9667572.1 N-acetylglucosamine-6-phosphate deacetylase [Enterococcus faecalis]
MIIQSKNVWINEQFQPAQVEVSEQRIVAILPYNEKAVDKEYGANRILPGFIDIHDHGWHGGDANHANHEFIKEWQAYLPEEGITAFLPTTSTTFPKDLEHSFEVIGSFIEEDQGTNGAQIIGIHAEGPMISEEFRGSHNPELLVKPSVETFKKWQELAKGHIKLMTLAPENDVENALTTYCHEHDVVISIGHTAATYEQAMAAVEAGAKSFTHTFNGMEDISHRKPTAVVAALDSEETFAEIIADGVHVDYSLVRVLAKLKGKDYLIAVTDSIWAKGCQPGVYPKPEKGIEMVIDEQNVVRLANGKLAGSTNHLNNMVRNLVEKALLPEVIAINSVTKNPARLLNVNESMGEIKLGLLGNFTIIDEKYEVLETLVNGETVYKK